MPQKRGSVAPDVAEKPAFTSLVLSTPTGRKTFWEALASMTFDSNPAVTVAARRKGFRLIVRNSKHLARLAEEALVRPDTELERSWTALKDAVLTVLSAWMDGDSGDRV